MQPGYLPLELIAANCSAHPAGPPFSRRNDPRSVHVLRSRQAYRKARLQRLLVLISAVEVASMITLMGWVRSWLRSPNSFGNAPSRRFCLVPSPQLNVELKHGGEIVVEREPAS